jgi:hypothetical protein
MKIFIHFLLFFIALSSFGQINFDKYFIEKTMRVDFMLAGNKVSTQVFLEQIKQEPYWGGSQTNLVDKFNYGSFKYTVYDLKDNKIIFSRGFSSLYQEWQATDEAKKLKRGFYETIIFPFPKNKIRVEIQCRDRKNVFSKLIELTIDPKDYFINKDRPVQYSNYKLFDSGNPKNKVDIVFIPDGYTKEEMGKFRDDAVRFEQYLFNCTPFKENKDKFNIRAIESPSEESGIDIPADSVWKNTIVNSSFYTFNSERYLTTFDIRSIRDIAANVPYDQIFILVNTAKYGGGGVYNYYSESSSDNNFSEYVFCHEFGHAFAGLGDEYYDSEVSVVDYYDTAAEPWEPNLSTLVNFPSKWKNMVSKDTPVPTPNLDKYFNSVGAFEGGGYMNKKMYRPCVDCTMKSIKINGFCPVCKKAIVDMILFYSE